MTRLGCGCKFGEMLDGGSYPVMIFCPLHKAAGKLRDACQGLVELLESHAWGDGPALRTATTTQGDLPAAG